MSIAALAKAKAEAAAAAAAEAAAAPAKGRTPPKFSRPLSGDAPMAIGQPGRSSPAKQRRSYLIAASAGSILAAAGVKLAQTAGNDNDSALQADAARILTQLQEDQHRLKAIQSIEKKIELKRQLLPAYDGWCDGVMAAGRGERGPLDELFTTIMAWRIDVGDFVEALPMIEHALRYDLKLPERFSRTLPCFVVEQISEAAIRAYEAGGAPAAAFPAAVLPMLQDLIEEAGSDMHDEVSAKLQRALGLAILAGANAEDADDVRARQEQTLKCYLRALELNPKVGVKKQVEQLNRDLNRTTVPGRSDQVSPTDATLKTNSPAPETSG